MDKGLTFLTLALGLVWLVFDDLFGEKKFLSKIASALTPGFPSLGEAVVNGVVDGVKGTQDITKKAEDVVADGMHKTGKEIAEKNGQTGTVDVLDKIEKKRQEEKEAQKKKEEERKKKGNSGIFDFQLPDGWGLGGKQFDLTQYFGKK